MDNENKLIMFFVFSICLIVGFSGYSIIFQEKNGGSLVYSDNRKILNEASANIIVIGTNSCPACRNTKKLLEDNNSSYKFIDLERSLEINKKYQKYVNDSIPVIIMKDVIITGYYEIAIIDNININNFN